MEQLREIVGKFFSDEVIISERKGNLRPFASYSFLFTFGMKLYGVTMIETDKKIYFDTRKFAGKFNTFLFIPFVVVIFAIQYYITPESPVLSPRLLVFLLPLVLFAYYSISVSKSLLKIMVLKKEWVSDYKDEGDKIVIKAHVPEGEGTVLPYFLSEDRSKELSLVSKLYGKRKLVPTNYKLTFEVK